MTNEQLQAIISGIAGIVGSCVPPITKAIQKPGKLRIQTTTWEVDTKDLERIAKNVVKAFRPKTRAPTIPPLPMPGWDECDKPSTGCMGDPDLPPCAYCKQPTKMSSWTDGGGRMWPPCCQKDACQDKQWAEVEASYDFSPNGRYPRPGVLQQPLMDVEGMKAVGALPKETIKPDLEVTPVSAGSLHDKIAKDPVAYWRTIFVDQEQASEQDI